MIKCFLIIFCIFLASCAIESSGSYKAIDGKYNITISEKTSDGWRRPPIFIRFSDMGEDMFLILAPSDSQDKYVGKNYGFLIFPLPFPFWAGESLKDDDRNVAVFLKNSTWDIVGKDLKVLLRVEDKTYKGEICIKCRTECDNKKPYQIAFPITVKDIGKKGGDIIVEYKGIIKEIPFEYERYLRFWGA